MLKIKEYGIIKYFDGYAIVKHDEKHTTNSKYDYIDRYGVRIYNTETEAIAKVNELTQ